jgi:hypothetical protein
MIDRAGQSAQKRIICRFRDDISFDNISESTINNTDISDALSFADGTAAPESLKTTVGMFWNNDDIVVFFRGSFQLLRYETNLPPELLHQKTYRLWELSDVYEVFIGPAAADRGHYKEFQVAPDGRWIDIDVFNALGTSNHHWFSGSRMRSFINPRMKRWSAALFLPWNCFNTQHDSGLAWNVNLYRASGKFHGDELLAWSPVGTGPRCFHRPEKFGNIQFKQP